MWKNQIERHGALLWGISVSVALCLTVLRYFQSVHNCAKSRHDKPQALNQSIDLIQITTKLQLAEHSPMKDGLERVLLLSIGKYFSCVSLRVILWLVA